jgi:hypothetical protein
MRTYVIFPKKYFSEDLLKRLGSDVVFIEEDKVDFKRRSN